MKKLLFSFFLFFALLSARSQNAELFIRLNPVFNSQPLVPGKMYFDAKTQDSIRIDVFSFYISGISFLWHDSVVETLDHFYHLVDLRDSATLQLHCRPTRPVRYDKVKFYIGIDSLTNVSGAMGGDLDPVKGMYWTWQSGYINFKLEGYSPLCATRNHKFQFHLGGYLPPDASLQTIEFSCPAGTSQIDFNIDLNLFLNGIDLAKENQVMSPGPQAVRLANRIPAVFIPKK